MDEAKKRVDRLNITTNDASQFLFMALQKPATPIARARVQAVVRPRIGKPWKVGS
jgi:hypothetical protein